MLVAAADGVGTKLQVAIASKINNTIGIDLVAMCVNDLVVQGAEPILFLDYFATGKLDVDSGIEIVRGIVDGCRQAGCALIGGETAEMPGMYGNGDYDLAGFAVGVVERDQIVTGRNIATGDLILGLASTGLHANGFSLARNVVSDLNLDYQNPAPFDKNITLGEALLKPTGIYVESCLAALSSGGVKALAHITGGGFFDNIPRVLPGGVTAVIDARSWNQLEIFNWLAKSGNVPAYEMFRTFNCGIGMVAIVSPHEAERVSQILTEKSQTVYQIGRIDDRGDNPQVIIEGMDEMWLA